MTRSPLAYPLNRSADMDGGGAADLQTDIMRFMAILSLCLVAIFALVQSIPLTPVLPPEPQLQEILEDPEPVVRNVEVRNVKPLASPKMPPASAKKTVDNSVALTRRKWIPKYPSKPAIREPVEPLPEVQAATPTTPQPPAPPVTPAEPEAEGFTLRFESDAALTRLVAASHVGVYAIESNRAQRMTVSESRISFWDASMPNTFHEMETGTVPNAVIEALGRSGARTDAVSWGVTLPGKLKNQLDTLMQEHRGGSLLITASGEIQREAS